MSIVMSLFSILFFFVFLQGASGEVPWHVPRRERTPLLPGQYQRTGWRTGGRNEPSRSRGQFQREQAVLQQSYTPRRTVPSHQLLPGTRERALRERRWSTLLCWEWTQQTPSTPVPAREEIHISLFRINTTKNTDHNNVDKFILWEWASMSVRYKTAPLLQTPTTENYFCICVRMRRYPYQLIQNKLKLRQNTTTAR